MPRVIALVRPPASECALIMMMSGRNFNYFDPQRYSPHLPVYRGTATPVVLSSRRWLANPSLSGTDKPCVHGRMFPRHVLSLHIIHRTLVSLPKRGAVRSQLGTTESHLHLQTQVDGNIEGQKIYSITVHSCHVLMEYMPTIY